MEGRTLYTESTHLKASANKNRHGIVAASKSRAAYWAELDAAVDADRTAHGRPPLPSAPPDEPRVAPTKISRTDPDSGYMVREGKPRGFFYLDRRTVDGRLGIITVSFATAANMHGRSLVWSASTASAPASAYRPPPSGSMPVRHGGDRPRALPARHHGRHRHPQPDPAAARDDTVVTLPLRGFDRHLSPRRARALPTPTRIGTAIAATGCAPRSVARVRCSPPARTTNAKAERTLTRHIWQDARERVDANRLTPRGRLIYARRKETVERSFADAKELFGHRWARFRGLVRAGVQYLLAAAAQNVKKIALVTTPSPVASR